MKSRRLAALIAILVGVAMLVPDLFLIARDGYNWNLLRLIDLAVGAAFVIAGFRWWRPADERPAFETESSGFPDTVAEGPGETGRPARQAVTPAAPALERLIVFYLKYLVALPGGLTLAAGSLVYLLGCRFSGASGNFYGCAGGGLLLGTLALWVGFFFVATTTVLVPALIAYVLLRVVRSSAGSR